MESGLAPDDSTVKAFFDDHPPGCDSAASLKIGCFHAERLIVGIADMAFGFPEASDAYLGLLLLEPQSRGAGIGAAFLSHLIEAAVTRGCDRVLVAVLDENVRGLAFWQRMGFVLERRFEPRQFGNRTHALQRLVKPLQRA